MAQNPKAKLKDHLCITELILQRIFSASSFVAHIFLYGLCCIQDYKALSEQGKMGGKLLNADLV